MNTSAYFDEDQENENDTVAERLRRSTRNRLGLSRVGSSPAGVAFAATWITFYILLLLDLLSNASQ